MSRIQRIEGLALGLALLTLGIELWPTAQYLRSTEACPLNTSIGVAEVFPDGTALGCILTLLCGGGLILFQRAVSLASVLVSFSLLLLLCLDPRLYSNHLHLLTWITAFFGLRRVAAKEHRRLYLCATVAQVSLVYLCTALGKVNPYFLSGGILNAYWTDTGLFALPDSFRTTEYLAPLAAGALIAEFVLGIGIWFRRYVSVVVVGGMVFHFILTLTAREFVGLGVASFSFVVLSAYAAALSWHAESQKALT